MKKSSSCIFQKSFILPLVLTAITLFIFLFTSPQLSNAGDNNISEFLSSSGKIKAGFFFISPALTVILRFLHTIYPANWWTIFSIFIMFSGLLTFLWFSNKRFIHKCWHIRLLLIVILSIIIWEMLFKYEINFTQTTTIAAMTGLLIIFDMCFDFQMSTLGTKFFKFILGVLFLLIAGSIRWKALLLTLPFAAMCLIYMFIFPFSLKNIKSTLQNSFKTKKQLLICLSIIIVTIFSSLGFRTFCNKLISGLENQVETNAQREDIIDYIDRYPAYDDEHSHIYKELDIKSSWLDMISNYATSDKNYFTSQNLQKMISLRGESQKTLPEFIEILKDHTLLWISLSIFVVSIFQIRGWKNCILPLIGCCLAFILCSLYFVHLGRFAWRVTSGYLLACILSYLVMSAHTISEYESNLAIFITKNLSVLITALLIIVSATSIKTEKETFIKPESKITDTTKASVLDYINSRKNNVYLYWDDFRFADAHNLWATHSSEYLNNYFPLISNFIFGCEEKLQEYGISDIYADLLVKKNIRIQDGHWFFYRYLKSHYQPCIGVTKAEEIEGNNYLRYSAPVFPSSKAETSIQINFSLSDDYENDTNVKHAFRISFTSIDTYDDYFINVIDLETDELYSYGLNIEDTHCSGTILCMKRTWNPEYVAVSLIGKTSNGTVAELASLNEEFDSLINP